MFQASIFSAQQVSEVRFSPAAVFKLAATMCELGGSTGVNALKTKVIEVEADRSQEDIVEGLLSAAQRVKTMAARPTIERSSITPGVVVVDNSQSMFQFVDPKGKIFVPRLV